MYTAAAVLPRKINNTVNDLIETHSQQINPRFSNKRPPYAFERVLDATLQ